LDPLLQKRFRLEPARHVSRDSPRYGAHGRTARFDGHALGSRCTGLVSAWRIVASTLGGRGDPRHAAVL
jgi:hypothetical protein